MGTFFDFSICFPIRAHHSISRFSFNFVQNEYIHVFVFFFPCKLSAFLVKFYFGRCSGLSISFERLMF